MPRVAGEFWARVQRSDSCWCWTGYTNEDGYGRLSWNGRIEGPTVKLTKEKVLAIRRRCLEKPVWVVALEYHVSQNTVYRVMNRRAWAHV
jgi:hypothetical protein